MTRSGEQKRAAPMSEAEILASAPAWLAKLEKVAAYCDVLAKDAERDERTYRGRYDSLADHARLAWRNWLATAADIRSVLPESRTPRGRSVKKARS